MNSAVKSVHENRLNSKSLLAFDVLFGLAPLLLLSPLLTVEFQYLWGQTAMRFFPIPVVIVACFTLWHLRSPRCESARRVILARGLFLAGVATFGFAVWRNSPYCAHISLLFLFPGWALERLGAIAWPRILGWSVLLATSMRLLGELQIQLQAWLVEKSSAMLGYILDGLAVPHLIRADIFGMKNLEFSLYECCTSIFSIHALASAVVLVLLVTHRSLFVALISLLTVPFWSVIQNVLLLLAVTLLKHFSDRDASQGLDHVLVELGAFMIVMGCCWLTAWFLAKVLLPVPAADSEFEPEFLILNSIACWPQPDPFAIDQLPKKTLQTTRPLLTTATNWAQRLSWIGMAVMVGLGVFSTQQVVYGKYSSPSKLPKIYAQRLAATEWKQLFPEVFDRLRRMESTYQVQRIDGSDRGIIHWQFAWQGQIVQVSVTLPFTGHPHLATAYEDRGWHVLKEQLKKLASADPNLRPSTVEPFTELEIANDLGGRAIALVEYHPLQDSNSKNEPTNLSQPLVEYQVMLFCESGDALTELQKADLYQSFQRVNEHLIKEVEPRLLELLGGAR